MPRISFVALGAILILCPGFDFQAVGQEFNAVHVDKLIRQLDTNTFAMRESAFEQLLEIGEPAIARLQAVAKKGSVETRFRALKIVRVSRQRLLEKRKRLLENGFRQLDAAKTDEEFDVEQGMWLIARIIDPRVRKSDLTRQLDDLAEQVREHLGRDVETRNLSPEEAVAAIRAVLFDAAGFTGNVKDYDNPNNSSLDFVLKTKKGLPILLSHVVVSVARRLEIPIVGIGTSGRFFCMYDGAQAPGGPQQDIVIDPFGGGRILTNTQLKKEFPVFDETDLKPYSNRNTVLRMLRNVSSDFESQNDYPSAARVSELEFILTR
jgi:regulator of sirC expression with transglutaminase-like and TPR domain